MGDSDGAGATVRRGLPASGWRLIAGGLAIFVAGGLVGATLLGDVGETPCHEVVQRSQPLQDTLADTFGSGPEGEQAARELVELADEHPGCFDPASMEQLETIY